ncbi:MAG: hypothetical protein ACI9JM_000399 [Halioglobus sp.]|jgi:hypothetical protein
MSDDLSIVGLLVALFLPWLCGAVWMNWLLGRTGRKNLFVVLGQGYFIGVFMTTMLIRLWDAAGFLLDFPAMAAVLLALTVLGIAFSFFYSNTSAAQVTGPRMASWQVALVTAFIALVAWRHFTMVQELLMRPLFAWDAWMNWAPKAVVWFHHGALVDFVSAEQWLKQSGNEVYTLGNRQASIYPIAVSLIQLWSMLGLGTWDSGGIYLPWIMASIALGLSLYGHLRLAGVPLMAAMIASYLLLSMPYLNVHSVMAGYADIWLAGAFSLAVYALFEWRHSRSWAHALLWVVFGLMCMQLKNPGLVLGLIIFACGLWESLAGHSKIQAGLLGAVVLFSVFAVAIGFSGEIPYLGNVSLKGGVFDAGRLGQFSVEYHEVGSAFYGTFFEQINWHLMWYLLPFTIALGLYRNGLKFAVPVEWLAVIGALLFIVFVFVFTRHYIAAVNYVTLNRALLYPVPAILFCVFLYFRPPQENV